MPRRTLIAVLAIVPLVEGPARSAYADEAPTLAVATRGTPPKSKRAKALRKLIRDALDDRKELKAANAELEKALFAVAPPRPADRAIRKAAQLVERGQDALRNFDLAEAEKKLAQATKQLKAHLGLPESRQADRARLFLAVALAHAQRDDAAITLLLAEYVRRYPNEPPDDAGWPPDVMERLSQLGRGEEGSILIRSQPVGRAYVDGREVGPTPKTVAPIPIGRHRISIEAEGHYRAAEWIDVAPARAAEVDLTLSPDAGRVLSKDDAKDGPTAETIERLDSLARPHGIDGVLVVHRHQKGRMTVSHVDTKRPKPRVTARFEVEATSDGAKTALAQLVLHLRSLEQHTGEVPVWAWIGAGAGAAAVGAGVALRLVAIGTQDDFDRRQGAMTQTEAFELRDRAQAQARGGAVLMGAGVAAIVGVASWVALDMVGAEP